MGRRFGSPFREIRGTRGGDGSISSDDVCALARSASVGYGGFEARARRRLIALEHMGVDGLRVRLV